VADISHALGFSESTNFVRFLVRLVGSTPTQFRARYTPDASSATRASG
jgi:AraC-like DNA-binding protein